jgi:hypothetical protein
MQQWLEEHCKKRTGWRSGWWYDVEWPTSKPSAKITIDDRAILFTGQFPSMSELVNFKSWTEA